MAKTSKKTTTKKAAAKKTATKKAVSKKATVKPAAPKKKAVAKKAGAKKAAAKKTVTKKKTGSKKSTLRQISPDERRQMIAEAAYLRGEAQGFLSDEHEDWLLAEAEVDALLAKANVLVSD